MLEVQHHFYYTPPGEARSKKAAVLTPRPEFDCLRHSFFVRGRTEDEKSRQVMIPLVLDVREHMEDNDNRVLLQDFAQALILCPHDSDSPAPLQDDVLLHAFATAILKPSYWLSHLELMCLAEMCGQNLVVVEILGSKLEYASHVESDPTAGFGIVALRSNRLGRVRSHFSRLVVAS